MSDFPKAYCNTCKRQTNHQPLKELKSSVSDDVFQISFWDSWEIIRCLGCEAVSFKHVSGNSHDRDEESGEFLENVKYYPIRKDGAIGIRDFFNVPIVVRSIFRETVDAYNYGLNILCAAGIRAVIEAICRQEGVGGGQVEEVRKGIRITVTSTKLVGKINGLYEKGFLTLKQTKILHEHRYLGNSALHDNDAPSKKVLRTAIEIIENVLDSLYEIEEKADVLIRRREKNERREKK